MRSNPDREASAPPARPTLIEDSETWQDGRAFAADVDIAPDATVDIEPGARIEVSGAATITVRGTLTADARENPALLSGAWSGIVVEQGGRLTLTGVDLRGAEDGIRIQTGSLPAEFNHGTLTGGPFNVEAGASFSTDHAAVREGRSSYVAGAFNATYLDYEGDELVMTDGEASVVVSDSRFIGSGLGDFFTADGGKLLRVEYSTVDKSHCPFHFNRIDKFELDHVTTGGTDAESTDTFGVMFYMPDRGPHTIAYSNFNDPDWDQSESTAELEITNTFIRYLGNRAGQLTFTPRDEQGNNAHTTQNSDARPRGTPGPLHLQR